MLTDDEVRLSLVRAERPANLEIEGLRYLRKSAADLAIKRVFDVVVAGLGLLAALPLFLIIAIAIKLDTKGPVFFRQTRVGRHRRGFKMWKFRKMYDDLPSQGPSLTMRYDFRMTRVGRILERTKLDELPQLINVLTGDMSVIGPRPEVPKFVEHDRESWNLVLSVKPGIFGANQLRNRNESELYPAGCDDVEGFYLDHILPAKLKIDADYARRSDLVEDVGLLVRCLVVATVGVVTWRGLLTMRQQIVNLLILTAAGASTMAAALALVGPETRDVVRLLLLTALVKAVALVVLRVPKALAASVTASDFLRLVQCAIGSAAALVLVLHGFGFGAIGGLVTLLDTTFFLAALLLFKLTWYAAYLTYRVQPARELTRRLIAASVVLAPLSWIAVMTFKRPTFFSIDSFHPVLLVLPLVVRPIALVLTPVPGRRKGGLADLMGIQVQLAIATLGGTAVFALSAAALRPGAIGAGGLLLDALVFYVSMSAFTFWQRASLDPAEEEEEHDHAPKRLLIAGNGLELAAYVGALSALPENRYQIVGLVTPFDRYRTSTIGGHPILGEVLEMPQIVKSLRVEQVVVVPNGLTRGTVQFIQKTAHEAGCGYLSVPLLSGILSRGEGNGSRNGGSGNGHGNSHGSGNGNGVLRPQRPSVAPVPLRPRQGDRAET